jgi:hypothetical protein
MCDPLSPDDPGIQTNIISTTTTLLAREIDVSCNLLYGNCVDVDNIDPSGCGEGGIITRRNVIIANQNLSLQRNIFSTFRRDAFTTIITDNINHAGSRFTRVFPSLCNNCSQFSDISNAICSEPTLATTLLNKKAYMFRNRSNNVISGPIINYTNTGQQSAVLFGGNTGTGLTRNQQLANMGRGLLPNGRRGLRFGVQSLQGISLYSNSNIYNNNSNGIYGKTISVSVNPRQTLRGIGYKPVKIPICQR